MTRKRNPGETSHPERILRYWKNVELEINGVPGWTYELVPQREVRESESGPRIFDAILRAVKAGDFEYFLVRAGETLIESRRG